ncbi:MULTISPECIES: cytochrome C assembly family protein [Marinobacter]|uniref:cytochrome C assembly family protein n=1 Tax=Marinobacter TaxID=2742 RepID=UPI000DAC08C2|nr:MULTISPECIES: cytochrome c biogenesis protein CcsA [Marinobacter]
MGTLILAVTTLFLYSVGTAFQTLIFRGRIKANSNLTSLIGVLALASHGALIWDRIPQTSMINMGFFPASLLISWFVVLLLLILNSRKPLQILFLAAYPLAALTVVFVLIFHSPPHYVSQSNWGMLAHIALAITAYSLFTLAAVQAFLVNLQNRQLKRNYNSLLIRNLPPLQTMESLLFELLWAGVIVLTLAIITGSIFVHDLFDQNLAHKSLFSILSWFVFSGLLIGHYTQGWRGQTASRWTLAGCALLMISYYGSKFALEFIFHPG